MSLTVSSPLLPCGWHIEIVISKIDWIIFTFQHFKVSNWKQESTESSDQKGPHVVSGTRMSLKWSPHGRSSFFYQISYIYFRNGQSFQNETLVLVEEWLTCNFTTQFLSFLVAEWRTKTYCRSLKGACWKAKPESFECFFITTVNIPSSIWAPLSIYEIV